jgi:AcrR family transcriptional regulator
VPPKDAANYTPEQIAFARERYADRTVSVAQIERETGMSTRTLYYFVDGAEGRYPALPRRRVATGGKPRAPGGDRTALVARLWRTAERQVREIEQRLARHRQEPDDRERDARVLAVLVKTLRELSALDETKTGDISKDATYDDDEGPRDIDEFRRELARRMDAFVASRTGAGIPGDIEPA